MDPELKIMAQFAAGSAVLLTLFAYATRNARSPMWDPGNPAMWISIAGLSFIWGALAAFG